MNVQTFFMLCIYANAKATMSPPRVVAISPVAARETVLSWLLHEHVTPDRKKALKSTLQNLQTDLSSTAMLAVKREGVITTIAALNKIDATPNQPVMLLWLLECEDDSSGTILMKSLVGTVGDRLFLHPNLPQKWKIAYSFFS